jgi:hypothetical protein
VAALTWSAATSNSMAVIFITDNILVGEKFMWLVFDFYRFSGRQA